MKKSLSAFPFLFPAVNRHKREKLLEFAEALKQYIAIPIEKENEIFLQNPRLIWALAKKKIDQSAAAIILQSYLDSRKQQNNPNNQYLFISSIC